MKTLSMICGILLLSSIPDWWPNDFYVILNWFLTGSSAYIAYGFYKSKLPPLAFIFGAIAILFNPISPLALNKITWLILVLIAAILFFFAAFSRLLNHTSYQSKNSKRK